MPSARDLREFRDFLRNATDRQVQGIYDKEKSADREEYADLAVEEARSRGIYLDESHATMLRFPHWRVDVSVGDDVVRTTYVTATTKEAAISKAKRQMRGAVSSTGAFKFKATRVDGSDGVEEQSTRRKSAAQLDRQIHATVGALATIRAGDRVTILDRFDKQHTGRAVMRGPYGWILNMGGKHGTPGIATDENVVKVKSK